MSRTKPNRKVQENSDLKLAPEPEVIPEAAGEEAPLHPTITLGEWAFEIHPMSDRTDAYAYDDSAEFLLLAVPLAIKVYGELMKVGADHPALIERITKVDPGDSDGLTTAAMGIIEFLSELDATSLIKEISAALPQVAAIACHYTDVDVSERDVKAWTKSPLNKELWRAVVLQFKAENIMSQFGGVQEALGEFSQAAAA